MGFKREAPPEIKHMEELIKQIPTSVMAIRVLYGDDNYRVYVIVNDKRFDNGKDCFHYGSPEGLELLSASHVKRRERKGVLLGNEYHVINVIRQLSGNYEKTLTPISIKIQPRGGYSDSEKNKKYEVVDTLLYSLRTQRYEVIRTTFDSETKTCFVDMGLFRNYVETYGKPDIELTFPPVSKKARRLRWEELQDESTLKAFGYSVSIADGLSSAARRSILELVVDLEILSVKEVVTLLDFFINTHTGASYYEARVKWEFDKKYIQGYKVNPKRFLIADN